MGILDTLNLDIIALIGWESQSPQCFSGATRRPTDGPVSPCLQQLSAPTPVSAFPSVLLRLVIPQDTLPGFSCSPAAWEKVGRGAEQKCVETSGERVTLDEAHTSERERAPVSDNEG